MTASSADASAAATDSGAAEAGSPEAGSPEADRPGVGQPAWRDQLGRLLGGAASLGPAAGSSPGSRPGSGSGSRAGSAPSEGETTALALQFELREMIPRSAERWNGPTSRSLKAGQERTGGRTQLGARPAMRTERGWARGALTWSNIGHQGSRLSLDEAQQRWFRQLYALHRAADTITVGQDPNWVFLDDFQSPALWTLLAQATPLGIALVVAGSHSVVRLRGDAEFALDLAAGPDGEMRVAPRLSVEGVAEPVAGHGVIGEHGIYRAGEDRTLWLAPVPGGVGAAEAALLTAGNVDPPVLIPVAERDGFLAEAIPALRSEFRVESSDGSVEVPAPRPAHIVLSAAWRSGHRLTLNWSVEGPPGADSPALGELLPGALIGEGLIPQEWLEDELPPRAELRGADAAAFLGGVVPTLERIPGIEVRRSGDAPDYREAQGIPHLTVTAVPSEREDWFDLGVLVSVDGRTVPFGPLFRALARGEKKLLLVDNTYMSLRHPAFVPLAELIAEAQDLDEWETGPRISRHQVALWAEFEDLADESVAVAEWRALVREVQAEVPVPVPVPAGIRAELRPYQLEGFHWLAFLWRNRLGGILADDMGLGKTLQVLTLIEYARSGGGSGGGSCAEGGNEGAASGAGPAAGERQLSPEARPFLVVAPTSVLSNWAAEAERFAPGLRVRVRTATTASSGRSVAEDAAAAGLIVTSYALFRLDFDEYRDVAEDPRAGIAGLVLDEAQFVKNARAQGNELAEQLPVAWKLAVTGTPMENSLRELFAICRIVAPGLFPSARRFEEEYVRAIERPAPGISVGVGAGSGPETQAQLRARRTDRIRRRLRPFLLRRTKALVATELPAKQEQVLEIELDPEHRDLYDAFLQRERQKLYGLIEDLDRNRFTVFRSLTLLRMLALDASLIDEQYAEIPSAKLDALADHATALAREGRRALVFSQFTSFLDRARARLDAAGVRTVTLDGGTRNRDAVISRFRAGEADVFLISLKAGGVGLNLTEADTVLLLDPWWNPASEAQAIDRTHRIGQRAPVHVLRLIALGTIEEKVLELQRRKRALFDAVIDDDAVFAQALTASDVRALLGPDPGVS